MAASLKYIQTIKLALIMIFSGLFILPKSALSQDYQGMPGTFVPFKQITVSKKGTNVGAPDGPSYRCWHGAIMTPTIYDWAPVSSNYPTTTTIDGYTGILIDGLLYVIYSGTLQTISLDTSLLPSGLVSFDSYGKSTSGADTYEVKSNCWSTTGPSSKSPNSTLSISLKTGIYIPNNYPAGTVNIQNMYGSSTNFATYSSIPPNLFFNTDTLTVKSAPLSCSLSTPPTIDFGQVNITNVPKDGLLASKVQALNMSCKSGTSASTADVTISFNGGYSSGDTGHLGILDSQGNELGYIRGKYADISGSCEAGGDEVGFDGKNGTKVLTQIGVGNTNVPITWSLCNNGSGLLGQGSAQATAIINWD